jgi:hypothetical protein
MHLLARLLLVCCSPSAGVTALPLCGVRPVVGLAVQVPEAASNPESATERPAEGMQSKEMHTSTEGHYSSKCQQLNTLAVRQAT